MSRELPAPIRDLFDQLRKRVVELRPIFGPIPLYLRPDYCKPRFGQSLKGMLRSLGLAPKLPDVVELRGLDSCPRVEGSFAATDRRSEFVEVRELSSEVSAGR